MFPGAVAAILGVAIAVGLLTVAAGLGTTGSIRPAANPAAIASTAPSARPTRTSIPTTSPDNDEGDGKGNGNGKGKGA